jgi:hypothetical protein
VTPTVRGSLGVPSIAIPKSAGSGAKPFGKVGCGTADHLGPDCRTQAARRLASADEPDCTATHSRRRRVSSASNQTALRLVEIAPSIAIDPFDDRETPFVHQD